jgi:chromosome segregation protein
MRIRRLKLSGFKSFVEPTELRVEPGLTGIVGPNGCGKSNLLEAIRWVMGEGSPKSLRSGGMDDVIFAGTAQRPTRDFAEVSLLLDQSSGDSDEVEVTRRIDRGAGSAYRINGRDVRAKDVGLLFADAATGAHSPALISQGQIGTIISAKPSDRRTMLEEAAGIAGLHVRRKDAEMRLRATEVNLRRVDERLGEMAMRMQMLRRQARAAERYRSLSTAIRLAEARLLFARWRDAQAAAAADELAAREAAAAVTAAEAARGEAAAAQALAARDVAQRRAAARVAGEALTEANHRLLVAEARRSELDRRLAQLEEQRAALEADRARELALDEDAAAAVERLAADMAAAQERIAAADAGRADALTLADRADAAVAPAERALAEALAVEAGQQAEVRIADAALTTARERLARARAAVQRLTRERDALGDEAVVRETLRAASAAREEAAAQSARASAEIAAAEDRREALSRAREAIEAAHAETTAALSSLEAEARALIRALDNGSAKDRTRAARAAAGYERALAAALGEDLDAPVGRDGPRGWRGAPIGAGDPALPAGVESLAAHVEAPAALARRLAQVGVVDQDDGKIVLAVGQRLVTRDGRLRRWDGFVASGEGAVTAERMIRINRLQAIEQALPEARAATEASRESLARSRSDSLAAQAECDAARRDLAAAEARMREVTRAEGTATGELERRAVLAAGLATQLAQAASDVDEAEAAQTAAERALAALPDPKIASAAARAARTAVEAGRNEAARLRAAYDGLERDRVLDIARVEAGTQESSSWERRQADALARVTALDARIAEAAAEHAGLAEAPEAARAAAAALLAERDTAAALARDAETAERDGDAMLAGADADLAAAAEMVATMRETRAATAERRDHALERLEELAGLAVERFDCPAAELGERFEFQSDSVGSTNAEAANHDKLAADRERLGPVNLVAERELAELDEEQGAAAAESAELAEAVARLRSAIGSLNREGRARLLAAFEAVDGHFRRLFSGLFGGGEAHLALVDADDPLEAGLEIMAQPPGKRLSQITLLSGGEQTLTAVALVFALFLANPAPICVLDEVDAPLDDANVERFCDLLDRMVEETDTRFLIVTHNPLSMSRMHRLYGVTMIERGVSRLVSVDLRAAETLMAAE